MTSPISLVDVSSYLPGRPVPLTYFTEYPGAEDKLRDNPMFRAPAYRHHADRDETNVDMIEQAVEPLTGRHGKSIIRNIDILLVHSMLPDKPFIGAGTEVARRLGCNPEWIIDVHNAGCAAFIHMTKMASQLLRSTTATSALVCAAGNLAGQMLTQSEVRKLAPAPIGGDGCGVGYLTKSSRSPILGTWTRNYPKYAGDMSLKMEDGRKYWEPGISQMRFNFNDTTAKQVMERGNRLVPDSVHNLCRQLGITPPEIDSFITNQPNRSFLRNWREALNIPESKHHHTFDEYGNLFAAGIPVTLNKAIRGGQITRGQLVMLSAFSAAGDFAGATALRWGGD